MRTKSLIFAVLVVGCLIAATVVAEPREPALSYEVLFSVPLGESGIKYSGLSSEQQPWGPTAFKFDGDSFWIADAAAQRLLRFDFSGNFLQAINLDEQLTTIIDFEVTPSAIVILDTSAGEPALVRFDQDGRFLERATVATSSAGVTGVSIDGGFPLLEVEGGARYVRVMPNASGTLKAENAPSTSALRVRAVGQNLVIESTTGDRFEEKFRHSISRTRQLGSDQNGNVYILVELVSTDTAIRVDWLVKKLSAELRPLGVARFPLATQFVQVEHALVLSPEGRVFGLLTRPNGAQVISLRFSRSIADILPADGRRIIESAVGKPESALACRQRMAMFSVAAAYADNSRSLSKANIDSTRTLCPKRSKPRNLTIPKTYRGVSYQWGGDNSVSGFNSAMAAGYQAGDIDLDRDERFISCARGIDCSALVSRAWGISRRTTTSLPSQGIRLPTTSALKLGDIVNRQGKHTALFVQATSTGAYFYESAADKYQNDRVVLWFHPWTDFSGYTPYRFVNVCAQ